MAEWLDHWIPKPLGGSKINSASDSSGSNEISTMSSQALKSG